MGKYTWHSGPNTKTSTKKSSTGSKPSHVSDSAAQADTPHDQFMNACRKKIANAERRKGKCSKDELFIMLSDKEMSKGHDVPIAELKKFISSGAAIRDELTRRYIKVERRVLELSILHFFKALENHRFSDRFRDAAKEVHKLTKDLLEVQRNFVVEPSDVPPLFKKLYEF